MLTSLGYLLFFIFVLFFGGVGDVIIVCWLASWKRYVQGQCSVVEWWFCQRKNLKSSISRSFCAWDFVIIFVAITCTEISLFILLAVDGFYPRNHYDISVLHSYPWCGFVCFKTFLLTMVLIEKRKLKEAWRFDVMWCWIV